MSKLQIIILQKQIPQILKVDNVCGDKTKLVIKAIQEALHLKVDGIFGEITNKHLKIFLSLKNPQTKNFKQSEFKCHCCGSVGNGIHPVLLIQLEILRMYYKKPITITSGFRCKKHNSELQGAAVKSFHLQGMAADINISGVKPSKIYEYANFLFNGGGVGKYPGFTHIDCRPYKSRF